MQPLNASVFFVCALSLPAAAQDQAPRELRVATKAAEPFAMKAEDGSWSGLSIELWERIAGQLGYATTWVELPLEGMLEAVAQGQVDVAAAALTVTTEREERLDFTHSFLTSGLAIAVPYAEENRWWSLVSGLVSVGFLQAVGGLLAILGGVGALVWLLERRRNEQFGGKGLTGLGSGLWFSAVTMTTVGYGDKSPVTFAGRVVGLIWMFASILMISGVTAAIASSLTVRQLESRIRGPEDLPSARVATVEASTAATWLRRRGILFRAVPSVSAALALVTRGEADAVVYDAPILQYLTGAAQPPELRVLPRTFERQDYALALPPGSELREPLNRKLLEIVASDDFEELRARDLGR